MVKKLRKDGGFGWWEEIDERCVMCGIGAGGDVQHLLVICVKFERDW